MKNYLEIWFWKIAIYIIKKDYGANCKTRDFDDILIDTTMSRCASCKAKEIIKWINEHIELLKFYD